MLGVILGFSHLLALQLVDDTLSEGLVRSDAGEPMWAVGGVVHDKGTATLVASFIFIEQCMLIGGERWNPCGGTGVCGGVRGAICGAVGISGRFGQASTTTTLMSDHHTHVAH